MDKKPTSTPINSLKSLSKDKKIICQSIIKAVEKGTELTIKQLWKKYNEEQLFFVGLYYISTTKKALCSALNIPIEAGCRYKRTLEKSGHLVQSVNDIVCPFSKHPARKLTTNPIEFNNLLSTNQTKLF